MSVYLIDFSLVNSVSVCWPFFVCGVTCLVNSVSVCEEKRERGERREKRSREDER